jgi:hypothetical protein
MKAPGRHIKEVYLPSDSHQFKDQSQHTPFNLVNRNQSVASLKPLNKDKSED